MTTHDERYRLLLDYATDAIMLHGGDGSIIDVNRQACVSLQYTLEELVGKSPLLFDPHLTRADLDGLLLALSRGDVLMFDSEHRRKDGTVFPVEVRVRPF